MQGVFLINKSERILQQLINNEKTGHNGFAEYSPATMRGLVHRFGNPHRNIRSVHIAGTNGKGSTAFMISRIFALAGYRTGLYISPHLEKINERISINGRPIRIERLAGYLEKILCESYKENLNPTYFDALTIAALNYFSDERVDIAVIETGLGGRLDSTNVVRPLVSVITNISLDHTAVLGGTISAIAREKAGIIKYRVPVVTSNGDRDALEAISNEADIKKSSLYVHGRDYRTRQDYFPDRDETVFSYDFGARRIESISLRPAGTFQVINAGLAITATILLERRGFDVGTDVIRKTLARLVIPGRLEIMSTKPFILFDPAHNPQAMKELIETLAITYPGRKPVFVLSFMKDKDVALMFSAVRAADPAKIIYYALDDDRCYTPSESACGKQPSRLLILRGDDKNKRLPVEINRYAGAEYIVVATGSFRLYPVIKKLAISITR